MLKNIDPILSPDLLKTLLDMGHGDEIVLVDVNYPAVSAGPRLHRCDGIGAPRVLDAILSLMPLDEFEPVSAWRMEVIGAKKQEEPIFAEFRAVIAKHETKPYKLGSIERFAFYERARKCFAIVVTGERRLYGNVLLKKGIIRPE